MITDSVYKHTYDAYMHSLNGRSKKAIKSFTEMYKAGLENPTQAKYTMEAASKKATAVYEKTTKNSELKSTYNYFKTLGRTLVDYVFNPEYRKASDAFDNAYKNLYPKTYFAREMIMAERKMP